MRCLLAVSATVLLHCAAMSASGAAEGKAPDKGDTRDERIELRRWVGQALLGEAGPSRVLAGPGTENHRPAADRLAAGIPFSFTYDGIPSARLLNPWHPAVTPQAACPRTGAMAQHMDRQADGAGNRVRDDVFADFPAVEWLLRLKNTGPERNADPGKHPSAGSVHRRRRWRERGVSPRQRAANWRRRLPGQGRAAGARPLHRPAGPRPTVADFLALLQSPLARRRNRRRHRLDRPMGAQRPAHGGAGRSSRQASSDAPETSARRSRSARRGSCWCDWQGADRHAGAQPACGGCCWRTTSRASTARWSCRW